MMDEQTRLSVQVQPNAKRNEVSGFKQESLHLKISAPPVQGKANQELISYLSKIMGIPGSRITIQRGAASRRKLLVINGLNREQVVTAINEWTDKQQLL